MLTKNDRAKLFKQGKTIFRSKFDGKTKWEIYQYSENGGWIKATPCGCYFDSKEVCDSVIDAIIAKNENIIKED